MVVNILGTKYRIYEKAKEQDDTLQNCDGYCDKTTKEIVVIKECGDLGNFEEYRKKNIKARNNTRIFV